MAPPYGEPDWATPGDTSNTAVVPATTTQPVPNAPISSIQNTNSGDRLARARCSLTALSMINIGLSAMMGSLGVLTLIRVNFADPAQYTRIFLSIYMVVFACILFAYELVWWQPLKSLNRNFRKNFGFMYGLKGKGLYLVFIAFLCLGLMDEGTSGVRGLDWATGIGWLLVGCFHVFIGFTWPEANQSYKPPTVGLADSTTSDPNVV